MWDPLTEDNYSVRLGSQESDYAVGMGETNIFLTVPTIPGPEIQQLQITVVK
jgi:hypothetical protein